MGSDFRGRVETLGSCPGGGVIGFGFLVGFRMVGQEGREVRAVGLEFGEFAGGGRAKGGPNVVPGRGIRL